MGWEPCWGTGHLFEETVKYQPSVGEASQTIAVSGLLSAAGTGIKEGFLFPVFLKEGLGFKRRGNADLGGYLHCPDLLMTLKRFPMLSKRAPACFVPGTLAGDGREVKF